MTGRSPFRRSIVPWHGAGADIYAHLSTGTRLELGLEPAAPTKILPTLPPELLAVIIQWTVAMLPARESSRGERSGISFLRELALSKTWASLALREMIRHPILKETQDVSRFIKALKAGDLAYGVESLSISPRHRVRRLFRELLLLCENLETLHLDATAPASEPLDYGFLESASTRLRKLQMTRVAPAFVNAVLSLPTLTTLVLHDLRLYSSFAHWNLPNLARLEFDNVRVGTDTLCWPALPSLAELTVVNTEVFTLLQPSAVLNLKVLKLDRLRISDVNDFYSLLGIIRFNSTSLVFLELGLELYHSEYAPPQARVSRWIHDELVCCPLLKTLAITADLLLSDSASPPTDLATDVFPKSITTLRLLPLGIEHLHYKTLETIVSLAPALSLLVLPRLSWRTPLVLACEEHNVTLTSRM